MPMIDCPMCQGRGECPLADEFGQFDLCECPRCDGTGEVADDFFPEDSSELPSVCPRCEGTGKYRRLLEPEKDCAVCNGTGRITSSELRDPDEEPEQISPDTREE